MKSRISLYGEWCDRLGGEACYMPFEADNVTQRKGLATSADYFFNLTGDINEALRTEHAVLQNNCGIGDYLAITNDYPILVDFNINGLSYDIKMASVPDVPLHVLVTKNEKSTKKIYQYLQRPHINKNAYVSDTYSYKNMLPAIRDSKDMGYFLNYVQKRKDDYLQIQHPVFDVISKSLIDSGIISGAKTIGASGDGAMLVCFNEMYCIEGKK